MKIDERSDRVALHYTGTDAGEPAISGVPARDLTENDIARILYVRHGDDVRGAARQAAIDKIIEELTDGPYRKTDNAARSRDATGPVEPAETPAEPSADTPKEV